MKSRRQPSLQGTVYQKLRQCHLSGRRQRIALTGHWSRRSSLASELVANGRRRIFFWQSRCSPCTYSLGVSPVGRLQLPNWSLMLKTEGITPQLCIHFQAERTFLDRQEQFTNQRGGGTSLPLPPSFMNQRSTNMKNS